MNKEILHEILNSESETLSSTEIENIMNEELDKSTQDMDTDLIDLCLEALNTVDEEKLNIRKKKYRFGRMAVAAAIFIVIVGVTIPVCARYLSINVPEGIVTIYKECFNIDISKDEYVEDINGTLEKDGIENVALPEVFFYSDTLNSNYSKAKTNDYTMINFDFSTNDTEGHVTIQKYKSDYDFFVDKDQKSSEFEKIEYFEVNGINVLVFGNNDISYIQYAFDKVEYSIFIKCDYDTACQIVKML